MDLGIVAYYYDRDTVTSINTSGVDDAAMALMRVLMGGASASSGASVSSGGAGNHQEALDALRNLMMGKIDASATALRQSIGLVGNDVGALRTEVAGLGPRIAAASKDGSDAKDMATRVEAALQVLRNAGYVTRVDADAAYAAKKSVTGLGHAIGKLRGQIVDITALLERVNLDQLAQEVEALRGRLDAQDGLVERIRQAHEMVTNNLMRGLSTATDNELARIVDFLEFEYGVLDRMGLNDDELEQRKDNIARALSNIGTSMELQNIQRRNRDSYVEAKIAQIRDELVRRQAA